MNVFMMMNTMNIKQIRRTQELKLTKCKKSRMERHCVNPKSKPTKTKHQIKEILRDLRVSPYLQRYGYYVPTKLTTLNMLEPYPR